MSLIESVIFLLKELRIGEAILASVAIVLLVGLVLLILGKLGWLKKYE